MGQARWEQLAALALVAIAIAAAGCGGGQKKTSPPASSSTTTTPAAPTTTAAVPGALTGEAQSAATGDIPDNQVYVVFDNPSGGYSMKYPEGWAQKGTGPHVVFQDKNNLARVVIQPGPRATRASVRADMLALKRKLPSLTFGPPTARMISGAPAIHVVYSTESAPNPVTNKRVVLNVDRYYLSRSGKVAVVDLGTPVGVDNVDAYRLMIQSFRWR
jgi:hypothetical protein